MNVKEYLSKHDAVEIKVGQSGADVYEIDGKYILKHVVRQKLADERFDSYTHEALFYQAQSTREKAYLPKVLETGISENEILILMKKYNRLKRGAIDGELIRRIAMALAALHTDEVPTFINHVEKRADPLPAEKIAECLSGWESVLAEHPGSFEAKTAEEIAGKINALILGHDSEEHVLVHGDCHWENLLEDETGNILLCDWQSVNFGGASGDLSFFVSRLGGDGVQFNAITLLDAYVKAILELSGKRIEPQDMINHMNASNVITSFVFWHQYLHGSSAERVREIYGKMTEAFNNCFF